VSLRLERLLSAMLKPMLAPVAEALQERDRLRAALAQALAELEAPGELPGLVEHAGALREGSETGDIAVCWTPSGIITVVGAGRTAGEVMALVRYGLARCRAGEL
jgi:hypothetical protein